MGLYRILVVDDDDDLRDLLLLTMQRNYEVVLAVDGMDALHHLESYEPDLAVVDLELPLMNGIELCRAIRNHPDFQEMPVLFLTAYASTENIKQGYAAGATRFMVKPIEPEKILRNVELTIEEKRPRIRPKTYTIDQLRQMEAEGTMPVHSPEEPAPEATPERVPASPQSSSHHAQSAMGAPQVPHRDPVPSLPRIMVVDDDDDMRQLMELSLRDDFEVTTARDGLEAVKKIVDYQPDVVLLDVMMPGMNGFHLLQSIRRNPALHQLPVLIVSARASQRDRDHAAQLGATGYIAKPFMPDDLVRSVQAVTESKQFNLKPKKLTIQEIEDLEFANLNGRQEMLVLKGIHRRKFFTAQEVLAENARKSHRPL